MLRGQRIRTRGATSSKMGFRRLQWPHLFKGDRHVGPELSCVQSAIGRCGDSPRGIEIQEPGASIAGQVIKILRVQIHHSRAPAEREKCDACEGAKEHLCRARRFQSRLRVRVLIYRSAEERAGGADVDTELRVQEEVSAESALLSRFPTAQAKGATRVRGNPGRRGRAAARLAAARPLRERGETCSSAWPRRGVTVY
eukprot:scaffold301_cov243-Pinguiococcus_pyrenoidosus.AAC.160